MFKREISEEQFKQQKVELEQRLLLTEGKIKTMKMKEVIKDEPAKPKEREEDLSKEDAVAKLISYFISNGWTEQQIRDYLANGSVSKEVTDYIVARVQEKK